MSKARAEHAGGMFDRPVALLTGAAVLLTVAWIAFTDSVKWHELLVGTGAVTLTILFLINVLRTETLNFTVTLRDIALIRRVPAEILVDTGIVLRVLFRDLFRLHAAGSWYRACGFQTSRRDPLLVGRSALTVAYSTMSPNMIVIGIDPARSLMIFHQLERRNLSSLTKDLGARP